MASGHIGYKDGPRGRSWYFTIPGPAGANGKRRQIQRRGFRTRREAEKARTAALAEVDSGKRREPSRTTVAEHLTAWLKHEERNLGAASLERYARLVRTRLIPGLGGIRLDQLGSLHIDRFYSAELAAGCSVHQVRFCHTLLKAALRRAVKWKLLTANPCDDADPPRPVRLDPEDRKVRAITDEEASRLLSAMEGPLWLAATLVLGTGLRRGEVLGLRWSDVDYETRRIRVRQTVEPPASGSGGGVRMGAPKSNSSLRDFRAPEDLLELLQRHRAQQAQQILLLGRDRWQDLDLVFCNGKGEPIHPRTFQGWYWAARKAAGLPDLRFHDLRHTYATNQLRDGVMVTTVSKTLGHANVSITLNVYSHVLPDMDEHAATVANTRLRRLLGVA